MDNLTLGGAPALPDYWGIDGARLNPHGVTAGTRAIAQIVVPASATKLSGQLLFCQHKGADNKIGTEVGSEGEGVAYYYAAGSDQPVKIGKFTVDRKGVWIEAEAGLRLVIQVPCILDRSPIYVQLTANKAVGAAEICAPPKPVAAAATQQLLPMVAEQPMPMATTEAPKTTRRAAAPKAAEPAAASGREPIEETPEGTGSGREAIAEGEGEAQGGLARFRRRRK